MTTGLKPKKLIPLEKVEQIKLTKWCRAHPLISKYYIHIANERRIDPRGGYQLKLQGVRAGVSDVFIPYPVGRYHGLFLELKRIEGSRISDEQLEFLTDMSKVGYATHIAYGADDAIAFIKNYLQNG